MRSSQDVSSFSSELSLPTFTSLDKMLLFHAIITWMFLIGLIIILILLIGSILFHFRWLVPYVPTPMPIVKVMVDLAGIQKGNTVYDLGAGDARLLIQAAETEPTIHAIGYEGAIGVYLLGILRILWSRKRNVRLQWQNLFRADLGNADVVFLYLLPHMIEKLLPKFEQELQPGTIIVTHAFKLPSCDPQIGRAHV